MPSPLVRRVPPFLFGFGLGAFIDGIVLHQLLQWHHMLSVDRSPDSHEGLSLNVVADGFFHVGAWLVVALAAVLTYRHWNQGVATLPRLEQAGLVLLGWGVFNLVEGTVNHHLLGVHHVRDDLGGPLVWDLGFIVASLVLVVLGGLMIRQGMRTTHREQTVADREEALDPTRGVRSPTSRR